MHTSDGAVLRAVLFDRDGTLVHDVPYNGDPALVRLMDGAVEALARLRAAGVATGIVTNQSGIGRGLITSEQAEAVTAEVVRQVGGVDVVRMCAHAPDHGCGCRKPAPGMIESAVTALGLPPREVAVVGDSPSDMAAALAAGCRSVLLPHDAPDLQGAVDRLLPVGPAR